MRKSIWFVVTTPFAANAFLREHLLALSKNYTIRLIVNAKAYPLDNSLSAAVDVLHMDIARKISPFSDLKAGWKLLTLMLLQRPDAVHSITPKAGLMAMLAGRLAGIPLRTHVFTGQVWANKTGLKRWLLKHADKLIARCATHVLADSASQCRFLEKEGVVPAGGISMLGNGSIAGVDLTRFYPEASLREAVRVELSALPDCTVFLFVGRIVADKGIRDMLEAFKELLTRKAHCLLWIVGPDEEGLRQQMEKEYADISYAVRWIGPTPEPANYMRAADIFLLPSYREGFGSVIIEAAACGIPAIAYRTEGVIDAVAAADTGLLVKKGDVTELASAMRWMADHVAERAQMGEKAHKRAEALFSSGHVVKAWLDFYAQQMDVKLK